MWAVKHRWFACVKSVVLPSRCQKIRFFDILHMIAFFLYFFVFFYLISLFFFGRQKMLNKGWNFFWRSFTTPTKACGSWLTPLQHNLALSPRRSWFFKSLPCRFSTFKSYLGILTLSECHKILDGESTWCYEATLQISSKSDKFKGGKSLSYCMK